MLKKYILFSFTRKNKYRYKYSLLFFYRIRCFRKHMVKVNIANERMVFFMIFSFSFNEISVFNIVIFAKLIFGGT